MCGIAGFAGAGSREDLRAMAEAIRHRGPDGEGAHVDEKRRVFLAHRRLAIIDIAGGDQPMWNEDHTACVIFNGEIYNHLELRAELVALGHVFRSDHSDTEVLFQMIRREGVRVSMEVIARPGKPLRVSIDVIFPDRRTSSV